MNTFNNDIFINELKKLNIQKTQVFKIKDKTNLNEFITEFNINNCDCITECNNIEKGQYVVVKPRDYFIHVVRPNQTILDIAKKFNTTQESIKKDNNCNNVFVGQHLIIKQGKI